MPSYIETYNHHNRAGALLEFQCDDAYTLLTEEFREFAKDLAQHLVAAGPTDVPLLIQPYYKSPSDTVGARLVQLHKKLGVKLTVTRYDCFHGAST